MKMPRELALIALCESVEWYDGEGQNFTAEFDQKKYGLLVNAKETALYIAPINNSRMVEVPEKKVLKKVYKTFTGYDIDSAITFHVPNNRTQLQRIGCIKRIIYVSDKWNENPTRYGHDYETRVLFYADRQFIENAQIFGVRQSRGKRLLDERGLIL